MKSIIKKLNEVIAPWEEYELSSRGGAVGRRILTSLKKFYIWSQREFIIRYLPVLDEIKDKPLSYRILEVGSGVVGLARCTQRKFVGVDVNVRGPHYENMDLVKAEAWDLPFEDGAFECVVSVDMLEHIPTDRRQDVVLELLRVSREKVILCFPAGVVAEAWERRARRVYQRIIDNWPDQKPGKEAFVARSCFLTEHFENRLPTVPEVLQYIKAGGNPRWEISTRDNESCYVWYWGVLGHMKHNYWRWLLTTAFFILFFPLLAQCRWGGTYRTVVVVYKQKGK